MNYLRQQLRTEYSCVQVELRDLRHKLRNVQSELNEWRVARCAEAQEESDSEAFGRCQHLAAENQRLIGVLRVAKEFRREMLPTKAFSHLEHRAPSSGSSTASGGVDCSSCDSTPLVTPREFSDVNDLSGSNADAVAVDA